MNFIKIIKRYSLECKKINNKLVLVKIYIKKIVFPQSDTKKKIDICLCIKIKNLMNKKKINLASQAFFQKIRFLNIHFCLRILYKIIDHFLKFSIYFVVFILIIHVKV